MKRYKEEKLIEMANLSVTTTGLSKGTIYISNRQGKHGARIKYYRNNPGKSSSASISISETPEVVSDKLKLTTKEKKELFKFVELNYSLLLKYWDSGETMIITDVLSQIKKI